VLTEGGLPPSIRWLQVLGLAVAGSGGLTVGSLRAALGSADASVHRLAEKVRACVLEPAWKQGSCVGPSSTCHQLLVWWAPALRPVCLLAEGS
jgi:hypothetical protein